MNDNLRLIIAGIALIIYVSIQNIFVGTLLITMAIIIFVVIAGDNVRQARTYGNHTISENNNRITALEIASMYLSPIDRQNGIWRNIRLSNKLCSVYLNHVGEIIITEKPYNQNESYRKCTISEKQRVFTIDEIFNTICLNFHNSIQYEDLIRELRYMDLVLREITISNTNKQIKPIAQNTKSYEKTDINNASESELTALPGISIVISKKIVKKREEIGGFKTLDDFFLFIKLKPHMKKQLREIVFLTKMKGSVKIELKKEREVDF